MDLWRLTARDAVQKLLSGEVTPLDLLDTAEARARATEPAINALPTLCFDRARARAEAVMKRAPHQRGVLAGLPVVIKDLTEVQGVRTTHGSPIYADHVPAVSAHVVQRIEAAGGLVCAKSNTPEFGAGASTFNAVFGRTANPWNTERSAAGSSGGSAAALAAGSAWLAHGSDLGGSLRSPASFCGVVGLRPSVGRVPRGPGGDAFNTLSVEGPMARTVADCALFLEAMSGADPREPLAQPPADFLRGAEIPRPPQRVALSVDLGGITPVEPEVREAVEAAARRFEEMGAEVVEACPDFTGCHEAFQTLRAVGFAAAHRGHLREHRDKLKDDVIWNTEKGLALSGADAARAIRLRADITERFAAFMMDHDLLLSAATIVPPFPVGDRTVERCAGVEFETYIDWLAIVFAVTLTSAPALSLPCGFTRGGLPIGLQMIGRLRGEAALLSHAAALEGTLALDLGPIDPRSP